MSELELGSTTLQARAPEAGAGHWSHLCRCAGKGTRSRQLTNLTPCSREGSRSTFREGEGDGFSLRKALFVRLHDEFENDRERGGGRAGGGCRAAKAGRKRGRHEPDGRKTECFLLYQRTFTTFSLRVSREIH